MEVLYVLDPNFYLCWESVPVDELSKASLLPWLLELQDLATQTQSHPAGELLELPDRSHQAVEVQGFEGGTFAALVRDKLESNASSIMLPSNLLLMHQAATSNWTLADLGVTIRNTNSSAETKVSSAAILSLNRIQVTSVENFWRLMLAAHYNGTLGGTAQAGGSHADPDLKLARDLSNTVIVLPRVVPQVHDTGYQRSAGVDPLSWGVPELAAMVTSFTQLSGASTLPSLEEWRVLPDKRRLHTMYQGYFKAESSRRAPPIPTVFVDPPAMPAVMLSLCHSDEVIPSDELADAAMLAIFNGIIALEGKKSRLADLGINAASFSEVHLDAQDGELRQYVLKREFAEGAIYMTMLQFPEGGLLAAQSGPHNLYRGDKLWRAKPSFPEYSPQGVKDSGNVSTKPFLRKAAMQMLKQGCGEGWLLQPKVLDMPDLEYRVYLVGGAQAQGKPEDTAVVYTPSVLDNGIYMSNITLPPGMFWSDVIESPGGASEEAVSAEEHGVMAKLGQVRAPWACPQLHDMIVSAALDGARAMAAFQDGFLSSVSNMFVRVDVVLAVHWSEDGEEMFAQPMINEMDWFNSAAQMIPHWPSNASHEAAESAWGARLARPLLRELVLAFDSMNKGSGASAAS